MELMHGFCSFISFYAVLCKQLEVKKVNPVAVVGIDPSLILA
jgi:hypothetical protein